jgi:uncharacterized protein YdeI (YjbR/CyaY-like superfamily)
VFRVIHFEDKNIVLIQGFKESCTLLFHKESLPQNEAGMLIQQTQNLQLARQIRDTKQQEILELKSAIKAYVFEAIEVEKVGLKVSFKKTDAHRIHFELQTKMDENPAFKLASEALTLGRQRGYLLHLSQPKKSKTRITSIEKYKPKIPDGLGFNDR